MTITTKPWYDTKEGIEAVLKDGLAGLHKLCGARGTAGYERKERLSWWCVLSYFVFDECGNTMVITEGRPDYYWFDDYPPKVFDKEKFKESKSKRGMTYSFGQIPPTDETCPRCLEGWNLRNVHTHKSVFSRKTDTRMSYHKDCHGLKVLQNEGTFFEQILKDSEIFYTEMRLIPAEYPDRPTAPWFMIETDLGPIKIGARRRVISISWEHAEGLKDVRGDELFKDESTTTDKSLVHAWGAKKAAEYLRKLMTS